MRLLKILKTLATHRVTYRFLIVLAGATGLALTDADIGGLETLVCTLFTCVP